MSCAGCVAGVEKILTQIDGVDEAAVNLATQQATFSYDRDRVGISEIAQRLGQGGYPARLEETRITVSGMHCASCVANIEKNIKAIEGVVEVEANYAAGTGRIKHLGVENLSAKLSELFSGSGYEVTVAATQRPTLDTGGAEARQLIRPLVVSAIIAVLFLAHMLAMSLVGAYADHLIVGLVQSALASIVYLWCGARFHRGFLHSLKRRTADMNTLISLGTSAAYFYSVVVLVWPTLFYQSRAQSDLYFETVVMIITLILLGRYLEVRAKSRSSEAIRKLLEARPDEATVRRDGTEQVVKSADLQPEDIVVVRPGERIAADGEIIVGSGSVDE